MGIVIFFVCFAAITVTIIISILLLCFAIATVDVDMAPVQVNRLVMTRDKTLVTGDFLIDGIEVFLIFCSFFLLLLSPSLSVISCVLSLTFCSFADKPKISGMLTPSWQHVLFSAPYNQHLTDRPRITSWAECQSVLFS